MKKTKHNKTKSDKTKQNKTHALLLSCMLPASVLLLCGCGKQTTLSENQMDKLPQIIVGSDDYPPYNFEDANGKPAGIDVDLATEAFGRMGYEPVFSYINWEEKRNCWKVARLTASGGALPLMAVKRSTIGPDLI